MAVLCPGGIVLHCSASTGALVRRREAEEGWCDEPFTCVTMLHSVRHHVTSQQKRPRDAFDSWVWEYFSRNEDNSLATCKFQGCTKEYVRPEDRSFRTDEMGTHLGSHGWTRATQQKAASDRAAHGALDAFGIAPLSNSDHEDIVDDDNEPHKTVKSVVPMMIPPKVASYWTKMLILALCANLVPFSLFKQVKSVGGSFALKTAAWGLGAWISLIQPGYTLPCRNTLFTELTSIYDVDKIWLIETLKTMLWLTLCSDAWTSVSRIAYRTVIVSGFDPKFHKWRCFYLATRPVPRHLAGT